LYRVGSPSVARYPGLIPRTSTPFPFFGVLPALRSIRPIKISRAHSFPAGFWMAGLVTFIFTTCSRVGFLFLVHHRSSTHLEISITPFHLPHRLSFTSHLGIFAQCHHHRVAVNNLRCRCSIDHAFVFTPYAHPPCLFHVSRLILSNACCLEFWKRYASLLSFLLSFGSLKSFQCPEVMYIVCLFLFHIAVLSPT